MGLGKLMQNIHKRAEIPYSIPNSTNHFWVSETSFAFPWTANEAQIARSRVDSDIICSFSEFNCLSRGNNLGIV